jgi:hypothetical protein
MQGMKTFKNAAAKYDGESTAVVFAKAESAPAGANWTECDELELDLADHVQPLWRQAGVEYFGRL